MFGSRVSTHNRPNEVQNDGCKKLQTNVLLKKHSRDSVRPPRSRTSDSIALCVSVLCHAVISKPHHRVFLLLLLYFLNELLTRVRESGVCFFRHILLSAPLGIRVDSQLGFSFSYREFGSVFSWEIHNT